MTEIPEFEGHPVDAATARTKGPWPLDDMADMLFGIGDIVNVVGTFRCVAVHHVVDEENGTLSRVHQLKPATMEIAPFDAYDPHDDGVLRAIAPAPHQASLHREDSPGTPR